MAEDSAKIDPDAGGSGKVLLVLGLLIGVAIGGGIGYFYFQSTVGDHGGQQEEKDQAPKGEALSVMFERLAVPIYAKKGASSRFVGNFFVDIRVNVYGAENQIAVRRAQPKLHHAFLSAISQTDLMREDSPYELDLEKARRILKEKANEILGKGVVDDVSVINAMRIS